MSCCCTSVHRLCDVVKCDGEDLVLPVPIPATGEYVLELEFLGDVIRQSAQLSEGDNATFSKEYLNEKFTYVGRVLDPTGATVSFDVDGTTFDCFEFTTKRAV